MPLKAAGMRNDPPVSVPIAISAALQAIDIAAPALDPPGIQPVKTALSGVP